MLKFDQASFVFAQAPDDWLQVIGIVGDTKNDGLQRPVKPMIFLPYTFVSSGPGVFCPRQRRSRDDNSFYSPAATGS